MLGPDDSTEIILTTKDTKHALSPSATLRINSAEGITKVKRLRILRVAS
jgi:hypothetical protein